MLSPVAHHTWFLQVENFIIITTTIIIIIITITIIIIIIIITCLVYISEIVRKHCKVFKICYAGFTAFAKVLALYCLQPCIIVINIIIISIYCLQCNFVL